MSSIRILVAAASIVAASPAYSLTLTSAGTTAGFTLSTFFSGSQTGSYADIANSLLPNGNILAVNWPQGKLHSFSNVDGQTPSSAIATVDLSGAVNTASVGGVTYVSVYGGGYYEVSNSLALTAVPISGMGGAGYGLWADPVSGHLFGAGIGGGIYDINPVAGTASLVTGTAGHGFDGVATSPDGSTVYGYDYTVGQIRGFNTAGGGQVFSFSSAHAPDGTAVISGGTYNGYLISNNNDGTVGLIDPLGTGETIIASGGSRGDFVSVDPSTGTLFLSDIDVNYRLGLTGASIGSTPAPEPASMTLLGAALAGVGLLRRRKR